MANKPNVLLLDEPTSALDIYSQEIIESLFIKLVEDGMKIIIVTHNIPQTQRLTDEIILLKNGQITDYCSTEKFFNNRSDQNLREFFKQRED